MEVRISPETIVKIETIESWIPEESNEFINFDYEIAAKEVFNAIKPLTCRLFIKKFIKILQEEIEMENVESQMLHKLLEQKFKEWAVIEK
jgi:hypothetical protein